MRSEGRLGDDRSGYGCGGRIENRCGRRDKSGFHPNLSSQRAGQITLHDSAQSSPKPKS